MSFKKYCDNGQTVTPPKDEEIFISNEKLVAGLKIFAIGTALGLIIYGLSILGLSYFNPHYLLKAILAFVFTLIILFGVQISIGSPATRMQAAILGAVFIAFTITVLIGYNDSSKSSEISRSNIYSKSETFSFMSNERWATEAVLPAGKEYLIKVEGVSVNFVDHNGIKELVPRLEPYKFVAATEGHPTFDGIPHGNSSRSVVTVEWK